MSNHSYKISDDPFEDFRSYERPSASAWIAVVAVMFAVFVLGCLIRTYRQLEIVKHETGKQIQELRAAVAALKAVGAGAEALPGGGHPNLQQLPSPRPRVSGDDYIDFISPVSTGTGAGKDDRQDAPFVMTSASGLSSLLVRGHAEAEPDGREDHARLTAISADMDLKRVFIEGGRDRSLAPRDSVELYRNGKFVAKLLVLDVFDAASVCEITHSALMVEVGDQVRLPYRF